MPSGVLPEQVDPYSGKALSVCPLTWSHASFVLAVHEVADRLNRFAAADKLAQEVRV